jgi:quinol monooxygenase YgiN
MIHVIAELTFRPAARERFLEEFRWLTPLVRAEDGCVEYAGVVETATTIEVQTPVRDDVLMVVEKWRDDAALAAHLRAPHMAEFGTRVAGMMVSRIIRIASSI